MVIRHSVKELLAKNSVTRPMKYLVKYNALIPMLLLITSAYHGL